MEIAGLDLQSAEIDLVPSREQEPVHRSGIVVRARGRVPWPDLADLGERQVVKAGSGEHRARQYDGRERRGHPGEIGCRLRAEPLRRCADLVEADRRQRGEEWDDWNDEAELLVPKGRVDDEEGQGHAQQPRRAADRRERQSSRDESGDGHRAPDHPHEVVGRLNSDRVR